MILRPPIENKAVAGGLVSDREEAGQQGPAIRSSGHLFGGKQDSDPPFQKQHAQGVLMVTVNTITGPRIGVRRGLDGMDSSKGILKLNPLRRCQPLLRFNQAGLLRQA